MHEELEPRLRAVGAPRQRAEPHRRRGGGPAAARGCCAGRRTGDHRGGRAEGRAGLRSTASHPWVRHALSLCVCRRRGGQDGRQDAVVKCVFFSRAAPSVLTSLSSPALLTPPSGRKDGRRSGTRSASAGRLRSLCRACRSLMWCRCGGAPPRLARGHLGRRSGVLLLCMRRSYATLFSLRQWRSDWGPSNSTEYFVRLGRSSGGLRRARQRASQRRSDSSANFARCRPVPAPDLAQVWPMLGNVFVQASGGRLCGRSTKGRPGGSEKRARASKGGGRPKFGRNWPQKAWTWTTFGAPGTM